MVNRVKIAIPKSVIKLPIPDKYCLHTHSAKTAIINKKQHRGPQQNFRLETVNNKLLGGGFNRFYWPNLVISSCEDVQNL